MEHSADTRRGWQDGGLVLRHAYSCLASALFKQSPTNRCAQDFAAHCQALISPALCIPNVALKPSVAVQLKHGNCLTFRRPNPLLVLSFHLEAWRDKLLLSFHLEAWRDKLLLSFRSLERQHHFSCCLKGLDLMHSRQACIQFRNAMVGGMLGCETPLNDS